MEERQKDKNYSVAVSIIFAAAILGGAWLYTNNSKSVESGKTAEISQDSSALANIAAEQAVLPSEGVVLPVKWGDLGQKMASVGVIDAKKFEEIYAERGGLDEESKKLLYAVDNGDLKITEQNAGVILNLLWALGLGNKNEILDSGPMQDSRYGGAGNFASTGGWTIAQGSATDHYSRHLFFTLTKEQEDLVKKVSQNIYRPCCGNSTYFPDCNHGMAMLGLLELMASQGATEDQMYRAGLAVNSYWFPEMYMNIAKYFSQQGIPWDKVNARKALGVDISSASGYQRVLSGVTPVERQSSGSCGV